MGLFKGTSTSVPSTRGAGMHTTHLPRNAVTNAKKAVPRGATKKELADHAREAGESVKNRAAASVHSRNMNSFRRKRGS